MPRLCACRSQRGGGQRRLFVGRAHRSGRSSMEPSRPGRMEPSAPEKPRAVSGTAAQSWPTADRNHATARYAGDGCDWCRRRPNAARIPARRWLPGLSIGRRRCRILAAGCSRQRASLSAISVGPVHDVLRMVVATDGIATCGRSVNAVLQDVLAVQDPTGDFMHRRMGAMLRRDNLSPSDDLAIGMLART